MIDRIDEENIDNVLLNFENGRKSGGGKIRKHEYNNDNGNLIIYYEDSKVALRVLNFSTVKIGGMFHEAKRYGIFFNAKYFNLYYFICYF